jgi:hypothetical protein
MLQIPETMFAKELVQRVPSFVDLVHYYGPYLALIFSLVIAFLIMQYVWYSKYINSKKEEIKRLIAREVQLNTRLLFLLDKRTGFKKK